MSEEARGKDPGDVWRSQPEEKSAIQLRHFVNRRALELHSTTRSEILVSVGSALFFVAVMAWRLAPGNDPALKVGFAIVIAWILITAYRFRGKLSRRTGPLDTATTGLAYYREELVLRRDHLKNAWLWHGPLFLAGTIFVLTLAGKALPSPERLWSMLPFVILLVVWVAISLRRRRQAVRALERELSEIDSL